MKSKNKLINTFFSSIFTITLCLLFCVGCGGGGKEHIIRTFTSAEVSAMKPELAYTLTDEEIIALGANIKLLSNACLGVMRNTVENLNIFEHHDPQIQSITVAQIALLTPAQVRLIGATGAGGATMTSKLKYLNKGTFAALVSDPAQVAAFTPAEVQTLDSPQVTVIGTNIKVLNDAALGALRSIFFTSLVNGTGQIQSLSVAQIAVLTPAQVRFIGSTGVGGATTTSQIHFLNVGAWGKLVSDPVQVAAITPDEVKTLDSPQVTAMNTNIRFLSNAALAALQYQFRVSVVNQDGQIQSLSAAQMGALSPEQVRWIGATGVGGGASPAKLEFLNVGAFAALASSPEQVAAITPLEVKNLYSPQITALGLNLTHLSDAALGALKISFTSTVVNQTGQVQSISAAQVQALTPAQIAIIASLEPSYGGAANTGIAYLNATAFASLSAAQLAVLSPANVVAVSAAQWASLSPAAFAGLQIATALSLSKTQKSLLSAEQHTACGC